MSKIVFVLGAGASKHCGTPLMDNFLEVAQDLMRLGEVEEVKEDFENVFDAIGNLHAIQSKAKINTYNIEDVYAAFEMGKLLGSLPGIGESTEIEKLTASIRKVIGYTLERTTKLPYSGTGELKAPELYDAFAGILHGLSVGRKNYSIITFNYDLGLDYSLYGKKILPDYGLSDTPLTGRTATYLKLHGSLNWGRCSGNKCKKISAYRQFQYTQTKAGRDYSIIPVMSKLKKQKCPHCGEPLEEDPFIVPPTWNKTAYHEQIEVVWKKAALELKDAENIFVLGYSLPSTDLFFNYLFALGVDMRTILKGFYVYNIDDTGAVEERFQSLLGSGIMQRFHYYDVPFGTAVSQTYASHFQNIREILGIS